MAIEITCGPCEKSLIQWRDREATTVVFGSTERGDTLRQCGRQTAQLGLF